MLNRNRNNNGNNREKFKEGNNMVEQERYIDLAYARVSTKGQSLERQEQSILKAVPDIQERYFFKDKYTGKDFESRPAFNELKKKIDEIKEINPQAKIRLTVHEIDRLGRDYNELYEKCSSLCCSLHLVCEMQLLRSSLFLMEWEVKSELRMESNTG